MRVFYNIKTNHEIVDVSGKKECPDGYQEIVLEANEAQYVKDGVLKKKSTVPTKSELRKAEILSLLKEIDVKSVRPLRAGEPERIAELEAQAQTLRDELTIL